MKTSSPARRSARTEALHDALLVVTDRLYQRDKRRFAKLIVWIRTAIRNGWTIDRIRRVLLALDKREAEKKQVDAWWPWCNAALEKVRTQDLEKENEGFKHGQPNHIKAILGQIWREVAEERK